MRGTLAEALLSASELLGLSEHRRRSHQCLLDVREGLSNGGVEPGRSIADEALDEVADLRRHQTVKQAKGAQQQWLGERRCRYGAEEGLMGGG